MGSSLSRFSYVKDWCTFRRYIANNEHRRDKNKHRCLLLNCLCRRYTSPRPWNEALGVSAECLGAYLL